MIKLPEPTFECNLEKEKGQKITGRLEGSNFICRFSCFLLNHFLFFRKSVAASWCLYRTVALPWQFRCYLWIIGGVCHPCNIALAAYAACHLVRRIRYCPQTEIWSAKSQRCAFIEVTWKGREHRESTALYWQIHKNEIPPSCSSGCWHIRMQRLFSCE